VIRTALHLHSTWSDGEWTVAELRAAFAREGCEVIGVVDHAESFDARRLAGFVAECESLSDEDMLVLPGLEFECRNRLHIVGYGVTSRHSSDDPADIIRHIADHGGVSVIAHPRTELFDWIGGFDVLPDGIEAWNSKYDGRHAPRPATFEFIASLRSGGDSPHAFYGIDLHWRKQFRDLHTLVDVAGPGLGCTGLLDALRSGRFAGLAGGLELPSTGTLPPDQLERYGTLHRRGRRLRSALRMAKGVTDSLGIKPPAALKAQLRRLF